MCNPVGKQVSRFWKAGQFSELSERLHLLELLKRTPLTALELLACTPPAGVARVYSTTTPPAGVEQVGHAGLLGRTPPAGVVLAYPRPSRSSKCTPPAGVAWTTSARVIDPGRLVPFTRATACDLVCEPIAAGPGQSLASE